MNVSNHPCSLLILISRVTIFTANLNGYKYNIIVPIRK